MQEEEMKRQQRMKFMKDVTKKIRSRGRMDAENRWWVAELLAADCAKAWLYPEEETMQKWYVWLEEMKKEDEKRKMVELHQQSSQTIKSAEGSAGLLHKITKPTAWRRGTQILKKEEEDAWLVDRCEAKMKECAKHWQCDESVQEVEDKPCKHDIVRNIAKLERVCLGESVEILQGKDRSGMQRLSTRKSHWT